MVDIQDDEQTSCFVDRGFYRPISMDGRPNWPYQDWKYDDECKRPESHTDEEQEGVEARQTEECPQTTTAMSSHTVNAERVEDLSDHEVIPSNREVRGHEVIPSNSEVRGHEVIASNSAEDLPNGFAHQYDPTEHEDDTEKSTENETVTIVSPHQIPDENIELSQTETNDNNTSKDGNSLTNDNNTSKNENDLTKQATEDHAAIQSDANVVDHEGEEIPRGILLDDTDESEEFAADHWLEEMADPVLETTPIYHLTKFMEKLFVQEDENREEIVKAMNKIMTDTAHQLNNEFEVFENCYLIPVGSNMENTKIGQVDEFDFAISLPYFNTSDLFFSTIFRKDDNLLLSYEGLAHFARDLGGPEKMGAIIDNLQYALKSVWHLRMKEHIPKGWTLMDRDCHTDEVSIAGTFHFRRDEDNFIVDVDVCFWTAIDAATLERAGHELVQRHYIIKHCLDEQGKVYAILPTDHTINFNLNIVRFAMSLKERKMLNQYGPNNGRLKCYKLAKCVASLFLPQIQKRENCDRCLDSLVSSFCLKNIVLYMVDNYPDDKMWTDEHLGNRLLEVFTILNFCVKVNDNVVSAFFIPYLITLKSASQRYNPAEQCMTSTDDFSVDNQPDSCQLPNFQKVLTGFPTDELARRLVENYSDFLTSTAWSTGEVIDHLNEMLSGFHEKDESERRYVAENPGCLCFQMNSEVTACWVQSVTTQLD